MDSFFSQAKKIKHVVGTLFYHLSGTSQLLQEWGSRSELCTAGLYHSAYSTEGFAPQLIHDRTKLVTYIGKEAEAIVYNFSLCDRNHFYENLRCEIKNRFSKEIVTITEQMLKDLLELTLANELDIILSNLRLLQSYKHQGWEDRFDRFEPYVSVKGFEQYQKLFKE